MNLCLFRRIENTAKKKEKKNTKIVFGGMIISKNKESWDEEWNN